MSKVVLSYAHTNTLVLLIELRAPLKKLASETTYFELLVLAFHFFEFSRDEKCCILGFTYNQSIKCGVHWTGAKSIIVGPKVLFRGQNSATQRQ